MHSRFVDICDKSNSNMASCLPQINVNRRSTGRIFFFFFFFFNFGEQSPLDRDEEVSEYSGNSCKSEDEVKSTEESKSFNESESDVSEDAAANTGYKNERVHVLHFFRP